MAVLALAACSSLPPRQGDWWQLREGRFQGQLDSNNLPNGPGVYELKSGTIERGNFVANKLQGPGVREVPGAKGWRLEANFVNDKAHGRGIYTWASGDRYEGDYVEGERTGQGKYVWASGNFYEGPFVKGKFHGQGRQQYADGGSYVGEYRDDKFEGQGTRRYASGAVSSGVWSGGKLASGEITGADGGAVTRGHADGDCTIQWKSGAHFKGRCQGWARIQGTETSDNGATRWFGHWTDGKFHEGYWSDASNFPTLPPHGAGQCKFGGQNEPCVYAGGERVDAVHQARVAEAERQRQVRLAEERAREAERRRVEAEERAERLAEARAERSRRAEQEAQERREASSSSSNTALALIGAINQVAAQNLANRQALFAAQTQALAQQRAQQDREQQQRQQAQADQRAEREAQQRAASERQRTAQAQQAQRASVAAASQLQQQQQARAQAEQEARQRAEREAAAKRAEDQRLAAEAAKRQAAEAAAQRQREKDEREAAERAKKAAEEQAKRDYLAQMTSGTRLAARKCPGGEGKYYVVGVFPKVHPAPVSCKDVHFHATCPGDVVGTRGVGRNFLGVATDCFMGDTVKMEPLACPVEKVRVQVTDVRGCE